MPPNVTLVPRRPHVITLVLPTPPSANVYYRKFRNRMVLSEAGKAYKQAVLAIAIRQDKRLPLISGDVAVTWTWYRARKSGDLDNRGKPIKDALQGVAYHDDNQVVEEHCYRRDDKANPRVEVEVRAA